MSVPRWIRVGAGPVVVVGVVLAGLLGAHFRPEEDKSGPDAVGQCAVKPDTVRDILAEPILQKAPRPDRFGDPDSSELLCAGTAWLASVSRPLTGSVGEADVRAYYAKLAEGSGWHAVDRGYGIYSAIKDADGGCPWWFAVTPEPYGYHLRVVYLPSGVSADRCAWK